MRISDWSSDVCSSDLLWFITICSFTTYALSHNVGASVISGGVVRYRAYSSKGLSGREIGALVAICSFTFVLGTLLLAGVVLGLKPHITERFGEGFPIDASSVTGYVILALVGLYVARSEGQKYELQSLISNL